MATMWCVSVCGLLKLYISLFLVNFIYSVEWAPVLIWKVDSLTSLPIVSTGDRLTEKQFNSRVLNELGSTRPVFVFLQDSLSSEDFTLYGSSHDANNSKNAFPNLEGILDTYSSTFLPSVESPKDSITALAKGRNVIHTNNTDFLTDGAKNDVVVFNLPATDSAVDRQKALRANDQIIGNVMKKAKALFPSFVALYTAVKSSWVNSDNGNVRVLRHVLAVPTDVNETGYVWKVDGCFLMYSKNLTFTITTLSPTDPKTLVDKTASVPLSEVDLDDSRSSCNGNNSALIVFQYRGTGLWLQSLQLTMNFTRVPSDDWYLTILSLAYRTSDSGSDVETDLRTNDVWAPVRFSWNCGSVKFLDKNVSYPRASLEFDKLQVQPFNAKKSFGDPFDCIGFFTTGIWMSIFSSIILIMILAFGINMVMSINTNDRFDDPKGKTITVNAID